MEKCGYIIRNLEVGTRLKFVFSRKDPLTYERIASFLFSCQLSYVKLD